MTETEKAHQQKFAVNDVADMIREGLVDNEVMIQHLVNAGFTYSEALYAVGYLKDNKEKFTK